MLDFFIAFGIVTGISLIFAALTHLACHPYLSGREFPTVKTAITDSITCVCGFVNFCAAIYLIDLSKSLV